MLGASPAFATGDADLIDLHLRTLGNGSMNGVLEDGAILTVEWDGDVDTSKFDKLSWKVLSAVDDAGEDVSYYADYSYAYYDEDTDDVEYDVTEDPTFYSGGSDAWWTPWAGQETDPDDYNDEDEDTGFVGLVDWDASAASNVFNNYTWYESADTEEYVETPWLFLQTDYYDSESSSKHTFRVQAWVDTDLDGVADTNEVRSQVATLKMYNPYRLTGTVAQGNVPGWFVPELEPTITLDQKLNDYNPYEDEYTTEGFYEDWDDYYLYLQQVDTDGNDSGEYDYWSLDEYDDSDGYGWTIAADGTVSYEDTYDYFDYTNEGSKVNRLWLYNEDLYEDTDGDNAARVSNLVSFGYVADSKVVRTSNTSAKMYAFDILNAGKVEFVHNGKVISSIDMVDPADPRALVTGARPYFVRTVTLVKGRNVLEVRVNGKVIKKHTYALKTGMA